MSTSEPSGDVGTEAELIDALGRADDGLTTRAVADELSVCRGRARSRLQAMEDCGTVVRRGKRTRYVWTLSDEGRDRYQGGPRLVADGGDPDDDRFDPEVEEIPIDIGDPGEEWGGPEDVDFGKWKLIGGAVVALLAVVVVLIVLRKLRK